MKDDQPLNEIGSLVRQKREELNMSLREFAKAGGVDHSWLLRLERGEDVRASGLVRLARRFNIPLRGLKKKGQPAVGA